MTTYTEVELDLIFSKARWAIGWPEFGTDCDGFIIKRSDYGKDTAFGWQVDHQWPIALGGIDRFSNLRPRHCRGNASAGGILGGLLGQRK